MPISIPPFTNVPAPGDPVTSPWAQDISTEIGAQRNLWTALNAAWTMFTPALANTWSVGNGVALGRYKRLGDRTVVYRGKITFGSTSVFGGSQLQISMPALGSAETTSYALGEMFIITGGVFRAVIAVTSTGTVSAYAQTAANGAVGSMVQGSPTTFAAGHYIQWQILYELV